MIDLISKMLANNVEERISFNDLCSEIEKY